jgi:hypothetical protein
MFEIKVKMYLISIRYANIDLKIFKKLLKGLWGRGKGRRIPFTEGFKSILRVR